MSLTPLLGELATYVGELVERIDARGEANAQADALFEAIDADGNGVIEREELRGYLLGGGGSAGGRRNSNFETLFSKLDLDGDGVICREELRAGYLELVVGEQRESALQTA